MPRLKYDIGDFKAGPFDIVISGFSAIRRASMGQIFEAWAKATGVEFAPGEDFIKNAVKKYRKEIADFVSKSIVEFRGTETIKPCGIIDIIRLHHHATTKISLSYVKPNSGRMLKLGEQEKLNLAANEVFKVLKELSIRSSHKWDDPYRLIYELERYREIPEDLYPSSSFIRLLKSIGVDVTMYKDGRPLKRQKPVNRKRIGDDFIATDDRINLSELFDS